MLVLMRILWRCLCLSVTLARTLLWFHQGISNQDSSASFNHFVLQDTAKESQYTWENVCVWDVMKKNRHAWMHMPAVSLIRFSFILILQSCGCDSESSWYVSCFVCHSSRRIFLTSVLLLLQIVDLLCARRTILDEVLRSGDEEGLMDEATHVYVWSFHPS